jgi:hypothetical protein
MYWVAVYNIVLIYKVLRRTQIRSQDMLSLAPIVESLFYLKNLVRIYPSVSWVEEPHAEFESCYMYK